MEELIHVSGQRGDLLLNVVHPLGWIGGSLLLFLLLAVGIEIREKGIVTFSGFVRWEEVESYEWKQVPRSKKYLILEMKSHNNRIVVFKKVHGTKKKMVDQILTEHVPQSGGEVTTNVEW
jgi:hypothetical protein